MANETDLGDVAIDHPSERWVGLKHLHKAILIDPMQGIANTVEDLSECLRFFGLRGGKIQLVSHDSLSRRATQRVAVFKSDAPELIIGVK